MTDTTTVPAKKPFWMSMTIWGTIVTGLGLILPHVGIPFGPQLQAETLQIVGLVLDAVGLVTTVIGRLRQSNLSLVKATPAPPAA